MDKIITYEDCPVCREPDVKVEHAQDSAGPVHFWDCPECGEFLAIVAYDCPHCAENVIGVGGR